METVQGKRRRVNARKKMNKYHASAILQQGKEKETRHAPCVQVAATSLARDTREDALVVR
jgi:hypothetical protein